MSVKLGKKIEVVSLYLDVESDRKKNRYWCVSVSGFAKRVLIAWPCGELVIQARFFFFESHLLEAEL
jgi:hypothetical protein